MMDIVDPSGLDDDELALWVNRLSMKRVRELLFGPLTAQQRKQAFDAKLSGVQLRSILLDVLQQSRQQ